jgi:hypothetical protein
MMFPVVRISSFALALGALAPAVVHAQAAPSEPLAPAAPWHFAASIYGYLPSIGGTSRFPVDSGGTPINVTADEILERLKFVAMGSFEAQNGTWGVFTDLVYLHFGDTKTNSRDFSIDDIGLPGGTTANLDWNLKGTVWTTAGEYRLVTDPALTVDLLGGARLFNLRETLDYSISGNIGPIDPVARTGSKGITSRVWDGIVGVKGRYLFGDSHQWAIPFYLDGGAGSGTTTVQVAAGIGYEFKWGELNALWRYLGYHATGDQDIASLNFNGPQVGAVFRW